MISKSERRKLKKVLGKNYSSDVHEHLINKGLRNKYGLPHSTDTIRQVMNGREHQEIEENIFELYEIKVIEQKEEAQRREEILNKKTGEATPA